MDVENEIDATVVFRRDDFGNEESLYYHFRINQIPDFVLRDLKVDLSGELQE